VGGVSWRPSPEAIAVARAKHDAARAVVRLCITGADLAGEFEGGLSVSVKRLERALAVYCAVTMLGAPRRHVAAALHIGQRSVQRWCAFVEAWREAPLAAACLDRVEAALPRALGP
jgi:hypothetical protein